MSIRAGVIVLLVAASMSFAARIDIGVDSILEGRYPHYSPGDSLLPRANWRNYGDTTTGFTAWFIIRDPSGSRTYCVPQYVPSLAPDSVFAPVFPKYELSRAGTWTLRCSTSVGGDLNPSNDTLSREIVAYWG